jgi:hypothetical protein
MFIVDIIKAVLTTEKLMKPAHVRNQSPWFVTEKRRQKNLLVHTRNVQKIYVEERQKGACRWKKLHGLSAFDGGWDWPGGWVRAWDSGVLDGEDVEIELRRNWSNIELKFRRNRSNVELKLSLETNSILNTKQFNRNSTKNLKTKSKPRQSKRKTTKLLSESKQS